MDSEKGINEIEWFFRSEEGRTRMEEQRNRLLRKTICDVTFENGVSDVLLTMTFTDGHTFCCSIASREDIKSMFAEAIEQEYYAGFSDRKQGQE